jgi:hypothetical protein
MKRLIALAILTLISAWFAVASLHQNQAVSVQERNVALFAPDLGSKIEQIKRIEISKGSEDKLTLVLDANNDWRVLTRNNFPAKNDRVQHLISILSESTLLEEKTNNPELWQHLGLDEKNAIRVKLVGNEPNVPLLDAYVGNFKQSLGGTYLRHVRDQKSWLSSGEITLETTPSYWMRQELFAINEARIKHITSKHIGHAGLTQTIEIGRDSPEKRLELVNKPIWAGVPNDYHVGMLISSFGDVVLADVQSSTQQSSSLHIPLDITLTTFDGLELHIIFYDLGDKWAKISARYVPELRQTTPTPATPQQDVKTGDTTQKPLAILSEDIVKSQVDAINRRGDKWLFLLPQYVYSMMSRSPEAIYGKDPNLPSDLPSSELDPANSSGTENLDAIPNLLSGMVKPRPKNAAAHVSEVQGKEKSAPAIDESHYNEEELARIKAIMEESKLNPDIRQNADMVEELVKKAQKFSTSPPPKTTEKDAQSPK